MDNKVVGLSVRLHAYGVADNVPFGSFEFKQFPDDWGFTITTSSSLPEMEWAPRKSCSGCRPYAVAVVGFQEFSLSES